MGNVGLEQIVQPGRLDPFFDGDREPESNPDEDSQSGEEKKRLVSSAANVRLFAVLFRTKIRPDVGSAGSAP